MSMLYSGKSRHRLLGGRVSQCVGFSALAAMLMLAGARPLLAQGAAEATPVRANLVTATPENDAGYRADDHSQRHPDVFAGCAAASPAIGRQRKCPGAA